MYADKIFAFFQYYVLGEIDKDNNIRHLIDIMLMPSLLKLNIKKDEQLRNEIITFLNHRIKKEELWIKKILKDLDQHTKEEIEKANTRGKLVNDFKGTWNNIKTNYLISGSGANKFSSINQLLEENIFLVNSKRKNVVNESWISNIEEIIKEL